MLPALRSAILSLFKQSDIGSSLCSVPLYRMNFLSVEVLEPLERRSYDYRGRSSFRPFLRDPVMWHSEQA